MTQQMRGSQFDMYRNPYEKVDHNTGTYTFKARQERYEELNPKNASRVRETVLLTPNTIDRRGMWPADVAKTYTDFFYRITVNEAPADPDADASVPAGRVRTAKFGIEASRLNALDAGFLHCRYEERLLQCKEAIDEFCDVIETLQQFAASVYIDCSETGLEDSKLAALLPINVGSAQYSATVGEGKAKLAYSSMLKEWEAEVLRLQGRQTRLWNDYFLKRTGWVLRRWVNVVKRQLVTTAARMKEVEKEAAAASEAYEQITSDLVVATRKLLRHKQTQPGAYGLEDTEERAALWFDSDMVREALYNLLGLSITSNGGNNNRSVSFYDIGQLPGFIPVKRNFSSLIALASTMKHARAPSWCSPSWCHSSPLHSRPRHLFRCLSTPSAQGSSAAHQTAR